MPEHFLISRTDGIGDVILTLPMAGVLKKAFPGSKVSFLGRSYTVPIIECSEFVDHTINWDEVSSASPEVQASFLEKIGATTVFHAFPRKEVLVAAKNAGIPVRIGTARRWHSFMKLNRRLWYSRKGSSLHEAQLNLNMLEAIGLDPKIDDETIIAAYGLTYPEADLSVATDFLSASRKVLIHPLSHGSALEWPLASFAQLSHLLLREGVQVGVTGTAKEREVMADQLPWEQVTDFGGRLDLRQLIALTGQVDGVIAASTGPLHIAAALGVHALGLYSPKRPIFPQRWRPIGQHAEYIVSDCHPEDGKLTITPDQVFERILEWKASR